MAENQDVSNTNIDDEIKKLAKQDEEAAAKAKTVSADPMAGAESFDTVERISDDGEPLAPRPKTDADADTPPEASLEEAPAPKPEPAPRGEAKPVSPILYIAIIGVLLLAIIAGVVMVLKMLGGTSGDAPVQTPSTGLVNNANFTFVNMEETLGGESLILQKYVCDRLGSMFYFKPMLPEGAKLSLTDSKNRVYYWDETRSTAGIAAFPPLASDTRRFTLTVTDANGAQAVYELDSHALYTPAAFTGVVAADGASAYIAGAQFSSSGTSLYLLMDSALLENGKPLADMFSLRENQGVVLKAGTEPVVTRFDESGMLLVRLDFAALKSLQGHLQLTAKDMALYIPIAQDVDISNMYADFKNNEKTIALDGYTLVLHGVQKGQRSYLLTLYTEDLSAGDSGDRRIEAHLDAELVLRQENGEFLIPGDVQTRREGSNVTFDISAHSEAFAAADDAEVFLRLNGVRMNAGDVSVSFNLAESASASNPADAARTAVEAYLAAENDGKDGYTVYTEAVTAADGILYARARIIWQENGVTTTCTKRLSGVLQGGVFLPSVDEVIE